MRSQRLWMVVGIVFLALVTRAAGLGDFMTVDEENWILRSSDYYENIFTKRDTGGAFQTTHPGATAMWLIGAGVRVQEVRLGYQADESNIADFQKAAKVPVAVATSILIGLITWVLAEVAGRWSAASSGSLLALDPYLVGMSQIAHLDALLALCMLLSIVLFVRGVGFGRSNFPTRVLVGSGVAAGLALATKGLAALWLGIMWLLIAGWPVLASIWRRLEWRLQLEHAVRLCAFTAGVAALTLYSIWPAMWVTPDLGRSIARDYGQVVTDEHVELELSEEPIVPALFYIYSLLGRLTPLVLIAALGVLMAISRTVWLRGRWPAAGWLWIYAAGYVILISMVAKKGDRYALPAMVAFSVVAGMGMAAGRMILLRVFGRRMMVVALPYGFLLLIVAQLWLWVPHTIAYNNPFFPNIRPYSQQGWGEGLEEAAYYLNESPFLPNLAIASWYPTVTGTYFKGRTFSLSSREDHRVGYVVLYRNMRGRAPDDIASNVLDEYRGREAEKIIEIGGVPYVWIYNTLGPWYFRQHVGEVLEGMEVGQVIPVERDGLQRVDIALATFSRENTGTITLHVRESLTATEDLREVSVDVSGVVDEDWKAFDFEPIENSGGKEFYVALTSETGVVDNAVTVRYVTNDVLPGQAVIRRRAVNPGESAADFVREGDLGYRLFFMK